MKHLLLLVLANFLFVYNGLSQEPTAVNLKNNGMLDWVYYDFRNDQSVHPMTGIYFSGEGEVKYIRLNVGGCTFLMDEFGTPSNIIQGPFEVEWDSDGKVDRFKEGYNTILRFYYDYDGRLEKVKDDSFNVLFALRYDSDGRLDKIDRGSYDYLVRFYYDMDDQLEGIKNGDYDYVWNMDYDMDNRLEKIKDDDYNQRVKINYNNEQVGSISKFNSSTQFYTGFTHIDYLTGFVSNQPGFCGTPAYNNTVVYFYQHSNYQGNKLAYSVADYAILPDGWNDQISSISIPPGIKVTVYEHSNFGGDSFTITSNWTTTSWSDNWNDRISSFRISYH